MGKTRLWGIVSGVFVSGILLSGGCGDDDGIGPPISGESVRPHVETLLRAQCEQLFSCCDSGEIALRIGGAATDVDDCTARYLSVIEAGLYPPYIEGSIINSYQLRGVITSADKSLAIAADEDVIEDCAENFCRRMLERAIGHGTLYAAAVSILGRLFLTDMFVGLRKAGEECNVYLECGPGLRCNQFGSGPGVCSGTLDEDDLCFTDGDCSDELICDYETGLCSVGADIDGACAFASADDPQYGTETTRCRKGLACDPISDTCQDTDECSFGNYCYDRDDRCPSGLFCINNRCDFKATLGEYCNGTDDDCASGWCDYSGQDYYCRQTIEVGNECDAAMTDQQCRDGWCDSSSETPTCVAYGALNDACPPAQCDNQNGQLCIDGTCQDWPLALGANCSSHSDCESGHCDTVCVEALAIGEACDFRSDQAPCISGSYCATNGLATGVCEAYRSEGEVCDNAAQCWGSCNVSFGVERCQGVGPGEAVCDGASP